MSYVRNGAVLFDVHIEPFRPKVFGHNRARLDDASRLRQLGFAERLAKGGKEDISDAALANAGQLCVETTTYRLGGRPIAERLPDQFVGPFLRLVLRLVDSAVGCDSRHDERHVGCEWRWSTMHSSSALPLDDLAGSSHASRGLRKLLVRGGNKSSGNDVRERVPLPE